MFIVANNNKKYYNKDVMKLQEVKKVANKKDVNIKVLAKRLRKLMKDTETSTRELAEYVSLNHSTISRYMRAEMKPKVPTVEKIAEYFNVNPVWLLGYDVPKNTKKKSNLETIAAHADDDLTEEEMKEVEDYIEYLLSRRDK